MNTVFTSPCQCAHCSGTNCTCGCQRTVLAIPQANPEACACASSCGCEAGESGCSCTAVATAS